MLGAIIGLTFMGGVIFVLYFSRSSKSYPKTLSQVRSELWFQVGGIRALAEDLLLKSKNKVELVKQPGRTVLITGGNRGIGLCTVEKLLKCDMSVILGVRNPEETEKSLRESIKLDNVKGQLYYYKLDIGNMTSVRQFAKIIDEKFPKIDILINNAGIMSAPFQLTSDGFESQLAINYLGHFLLTHLLLPKLIVSGKPELNARIINVSSCVHYLGNINFDDIHGLKSYYPPDAYNQSKLAQILFTKHLQSVFNKENNVNVQVNAVHPGVVNTNLFEHSRTLPFLKELLFKDPEQGSRTVVFAVISAKVEGKGGHYFSNCQFARVNPIAKNEEFCEKFFNFTCNMLKINKFGKPDQDVKK